MGQPNGTEFSVKGPVGLNVTVLEADEGKNTEGECFEPGSGQRLPPAGRLVQRLARLASRLVHAVTGIYGTSRPAIPRAMWVVGLWTVSLCMGLCTSHFYVSTYVFQMYFKCTTVCNCSGASVAGAEQRCGQLCAGPRRHSPSQPQRVKQRQQQWRRQ